jgi:hypothetical protein
MKRMVESMRSLDLFLWGLSICNKRLDILALMTKAIVLSWWASETRMSLNRKDVVRKVLTLYFREDKLLPKFGNI